MNKLPVELTALVKDSTIKMLIFIWPDDPDVSTVQLSSGSTNTFYSFLIIEIKI